MCVCLSVCLFVFSGGCDDVIPVNQLHTIRLDTSRAGAGHVTCDVITETGSVMRAAADGGDDDDVREVTYTPTVCQTHNVYVYFGGQLIPDGHVLQQVTDTHRQTDRQTDEHADTSSVS